jgi:L-aminopeptidase/D-esterase-like protein
MIRERLPFCPTMMDDVHRSAGSLCDVPGLAVGHATDTTGVTGCTVILCEAGAVGGVDVRGAAPGTRETDLLRPDCTVEQVQAILLTGGSAFGLDAATGVMRYLEARGAGFAVRQGVVPIVPAAVIFDLGIGDFRARPDADMGLAACSAASVAAPAEGSVGAGTGATVNKAHGRTHMLKGGIGTASVQVDGYTVAALVVVNAFGAVVDDAGRPLTATAAGADAPAGRRAAGATTGTGPVAVSRAAGTAASQDDAPQLGANTTIGVVATDLPLDKAGASRLAQAAHDGLAQAVRPAHTAYDGDTFFALSTAQGSLPVWPVPPAITGAVADLVALAIRRAVRLAEGRGGVPGLFDAPTEAAP